jgi:S1-C subfamily serine protease
VVIKEVQDGPAAMIGLRPGDVISHLNNQAIGSAKEFTEIAKDLPKNRSVSMRVLRQGRASFITFKLAECWSGRKSGSFGCPFRNGQFHSLPRGGLPWR